jgi:2,3-dihydroxybenzoate-AMP ligase
VSLPDLDHTPWPAETAQRYRDAGYWRGQTFGSWLTERAGLFGTRTAAVGENGRWSFAELDERAHRIAAGLVARGIGPGDRVILQVPNRPEFLSTVFGIWRSGAWPVFALPAHRETELRHFAAQTEAAAIITVGVHERHDHAAVAHGLGLAHTLVLDTPEWTDLAATPSRELPDPDPEGVAFLQLSGGSTGLPKLIPRTHDDYLYSVRESAAICGLTPESVYLAALPAAHNYPLSSPGVLGAVHAGAASVFAPRPDADTAFRLIERERVTITGVVPPLAAAWVQAAARTAHDLSSLEVLLVGGAKCGRELAARIGPALGCRLQQVFGMAEGLVNYVRLDDPPEIALETQGRPISEADEVRVVDGYDRDVAPGETGALLTRGPYTIRGYFRAGAHNAGAFTDDGFYRTGDLVRRRGAYLEVVGRAKEQINRGGEKVAAEEVEDHLMAHPGVLDAAVVGVPDEFLGERTCAYVVPAEGATPTTSELRRFVRERGIAAFKVPDLVEIVPAFPVTGVGKTSKRELRAALAALKG